jgi:general secretion pathway protein G
VIKTEILDSDQGGLTTMNSNNSKKRGFTIIEILMVLTLLGLVFSFVGGKLFSSFSQGQVRATRLAIKKLEGSLDRFRLDCNFYPTTEQGLAALGTAPTSGRQCPNYDPSGYLDGRRTPPKDPWDRDFLYTSDGLDYEIKSLGADGLEGGEGERADISSRDE